MIENEYKIMLTKKEFFYLKRKLKKCTRIVQRNYYYDTYNLLLYESDVTLRVREINGNLKLQYKSKPLIKNKIYTREEKEKTINRVPFQIENDFSEMQTPINNFYCIGNMLTIRYKEIINGLEICIDENHYLGITDYELELESPNTELIEKWLNKIQSVVNVNTKPAKPKYNRWINEYKKFKNNDIFSKFDKTAKNNNNIAIIDENENPITYIELLNYSNMLSNYILSNYSKKLSLNEPLGILMDKSYKQIIVMLAALKLGIPFLPLDTGYTNERIEYMINNSKTPLIICDSNKFQISNKIDLILYSDVFSDEPKLNDFNIVNKTCIDNMAYIVYTSGSTGVPKGVVIRQNAIINTLLWRIKYYNLNKSDTALQMLSISFDSSIEDIFCSLLSGGCLVLVNQKKKLNVKYLVALIKKYKITYFLTVPSYYKYLLDKLDNNTSLTKVILAGENFYKDLVDKHFSILKNVKLFNEYGPTENSVCTTVSEIFNSSNITIGKPISNTSIKIINKDSQGIGELAITGPGLFDGYLNDIELTQKKTQYSEGLRWYLTGDLVKYNKNNDLIFIGRNDSQIKINGKKFNLTEIDSLLINHPKILFSKSIHEKINCINTIITFVQYSYCVDKQVAYDEIIQYLKCYLTNDELPHNIVFITKIPLLNNGKVDVNKLKKQFFKEV